MAKVYFLCYRVSLGTKLVDWGTPTGGLVMNAEVVDGIPVPDNELAQVVMEDRYHVNPHFEYLLVREVTREQDTWAAFLLHSAYDKQLREFKELMASA